MKRFLHIQSCQRSRMHDMRVHDMRVGIFECQQTCEKPTKAKCLCEVKDYHFALLTFERSTAGRCSLTKCVGAH